MPVLLLPCTVKNLEFKTDTLMSDVDTKTLTCDS